MRRANKSEIQSLTGLRGLAALLVVLYHFLSAQRFSTNPLSNFLMHGYLAVDVFFVLSGFVMALNYSHMFSGGFRVTAYKKFLGRRIARVYPLYLAGTACALVLIYIGLVEYRHSGSMWTALLENLSLIQAWSLNPSFDGPGWSISAEWAAYLVFPLLLIPTLRRSRLSACAVWLLATAMVGTICFAPQTTLPRVLPDALLNLPNPRFAAPLFRCIPEFTLGLLAFRMSRSSVGALLTARRWPATVICFVLLTLMCIPRTDLAVVTLVPFFIVSVAAGEQLPTRALAVRPAVFLGQISYSVYIMHDLFTGMVNTIAINLENRGVRHTQTIGAAVGLAATALVSLLAYKAIEVPGRDWIRRAFEKEPALRPATIADFAIPE